jgi:hypothetical protein
MKSAPSSDRTPIHIKSPPSSLERVINYDANFDRDNPSLATSSLNVLLSDWTPKAINSPPSSYNVLSDRTPNNIKSPLPSSIDTKLQQQLSNILSPFSEQSLPSLPSNVSSPSLELKAISLSSSNDIKLQQQLSLSSSNDTKLHQQASDYTKLIKPPTIFGTSIVII